MSDVTEKIKARIGVADLIGEYLKLDRAGSNFRALCPFHNEKTPSFMVNPDRNFWYCFGCQKGGDIFTFIQEIEGISFREALVRLAERAGVELEKWENKTGEGVQKDEKKIVLQILEEACVFFQNQLEKTFLGTEIKKYLFQRGLNEESIKLFRLGLIPPGWRQLLDFLLSRGYFLNQIEKTGLLVRKEGTNFQDKNNYYDRFRERIIFPVVDYFGKVVGFSARVLPGGDEKTAKYINTPQTLVYDKSQVLYGLFQAKGEIKKQNRVIITEGNMDVIASFAAGVKNIIAISGTAFSEKQASLIKRLTDKVSLCLDMDQAGQTATAKTIKICLKNDLETDVLILPKGNKDINDLVVKDKSLWYRLTQEDSVSIMDYFFQKVFLAYNKNNPRGKKMIVRDLLNLIKEIADPVEKGYWIKRLAQETEVDSETLFTVLEKVKAKSEQEEGNRQEIKKKKSYFSEKEDKLIFLQKQALGIFFLFRDKLKKEVINFKKELFDDEYLEFFQKIISQKELSREEKNLLENFAVKARFDFDDGTGFRERTSSPLLEWKAILANIQQERKKRNLMQIAQDLKKAEKDGDKETVLILSQEYDRLLKEK